MNRLRVNPHLGELANLGLRLPSSSRLRWGSSSKTRPWWGVLEPLGWPTGCLSVLIPLTLAPLDSGYGGGASTDFFPHMCLLQGPGPLPSPHIFPLASCLGLGRHGVGGEPRSGTPVPLAPLSHGGH